MIPCDGATHEVLVVRPDDGRAIQWNTYRTREDADAERIKLARIGMYAVVRRLDLAAATPDGTGATP